MKRTIILGLLALLLIAAAGGGYWAYTRYAVPQVVAQEATLQTGTVSRGDLVITADGTGNLLPGAEVNLAFKVNGTVTEVKIAVGDKVRQGDVLVKLDMSELYTTLRAATYQLEQAQLELQSAQRKAQAGTDAELAKRNVEIARLALVNAQGSYASMLLSDNVNANVRQAEFEAAYWAGVQGDAWLKLDEQPANEKRQEKYEEASIQADRAANNLRQLKQDAQNQKVAGWRNVLSAQQAYLTALANYTETISTDPVRAAELTVLQNEIKTAQAQSDFDNAVLRAPLSGTVTVMKAVVGEYAGTASIITLIDLDHPQVRFWVEEADLAKVVVGNKINVTFEALPDETFTGQITRVEPELVTVGNTTAVQAWASLDNPKGITLLSGMTAEVEVIAAEARNALLAPVQALRQMADNQYAVFVVKADGTLEMRLVTVGLQDLVNAEILSGLEEGETISLGSTKSTQTQSSGSNQQQNFGPPDGGIMIMPPGGMP